MSFGVAGNDSVSCLGRNCMLHYPLSVTFPPHTVTPTRRTQKPQTRVMPASPGDRASDILARESDKAVEDAQRCRALVQVTAR